MPRNSNFAPSQGLSTRLGTLCKDLPLSDKLNRDVKEIFVKDVNELFNTLIQESLRYIGKPVAIE